jgi:hypothetical protein
MKELNSKNISDLKEYLKSLPPDFVEKKNQEQLEGNRKMFEEFKDAYSKGCCFLCGNKLDYFSSSETCFHWFLRPLGIKKKHFKDYLSEPIGFFRLESYLRWVATMDKFLKNINDLQCETTKSKLKEITIKYKNIEWSLTYGKTDLEGHSDTKNAAFPHFHIQMFVDGDPFIRFNDFHIPFSEADLFDIKLMEEANDIIDFKYDQGPGMSVLEDEELFKEIDQVVQVSESMDTAMFYNQTLVSMPEGKTMSGDKLCELFKESKETKVPVRHLIKRCFPEAIIVTRVEPADGVPEKKRRNKR